MVKGRLELFRKFIRFGDATRPLHSLSHMIDLQHGMMVMVTTCIYFLFVALESVAGESV